MTDLAQGIKKACPICDRVDPAHEAQVLPSGHILYRFLCSRCGWPHQKRVSPPETTVEPLVGFKREPYRWEARP